MSRGVVAVTAVITSSLSATLEMSRGVVAVTTVFPRVADFRFTESNAAQRKKTQRLFDVKIIYRGFSF
jgi:hypothetical protein